jgi:hypothetical protein
MRKAPCKAEFSRSSEKYPDIFNLTLISVRLRSMACRQPYFGVKHA